MNNVARYVARWALAVTMVVSGSLWMGGSAWAALPGLDATKNYNVEYENSVGQFRTLKQVKVVDVATIGPDQFLVVESVAATNPVRGFVKLQDVKSILPENF